VGSANHNTASLHGQAVFSAFEKAMPASRLLLMLEMPCAHLLPKVNFPMKPMTGVARLAQWIQVVLESTMLARKQTVSSGEGSQGNLVSEPLQALHEMLHPIPRTAHRQFPSHTPLTAGFIDRYPEPGRWGILPRVLAARRRHLWVHLRFWVQLLGGFALPPSNIDLSGISLGA
jgi:hypothetical protein